MGKQRLKFRRKRKKILSLLYVYRVVAAEHDFRETCVLSSYAIKSESLLRFGYQ
jgi:hypothetical protein